MTFAGMTDIAALLLHVEIIEVAVGDLAGQSAVLRLAVIPGGRKNLKHNRVALIDLLGELPGEL